MTDHPTALLTQNIDMLEDTYYGVNKLPRLLRGKRHFNIAFSEYSTLVTLYEMTYPLIGANGLHEKRDNETFTTASSRSH